jgi:predicted nucleic acid-binding protein
MSLFEDVMSLAVQMPMDERERLGRALGLSVHTKGPGKTLPLNAFVAQPDATAWRKAETGHAVLDTGNVPTEAEIPTGPAALAGQWAQSENTTIPSDPNLPPASSLPRGGPVLVHTSVCLALAQGDERALSWWNDLPVEARLATATYLTLLDAATDANQLLRVRRFVQPYAVLSLGPMASSRSVELVTAGKADGLGALDALIAATALAHEIPLVVLDPSPFRSISALQLVRPF